MGQASILQATLPAKWHGCGHGAIGSATSSAVLTLAVTALSVGFAPAGSAAPFVEPTANFCSATATLAYQACVHEVADDYFNGLGRCVNEANGKTRTECIEDAEAARPVSNQECRAQKAAREQVCQSVGEGRHDPAFNASAFTGNFKLNTPLNPFFPLKVGHRWVYSGNERVVVEVLERTKRISGVPCVVVRDRVTEQGRLVEDTFDWFAQARNGDVYYCGEEVKDYEYFAGDKPLLPELVSNDGSFKVGRDGDKPGIAFWRTPHLGRTYRQEFSLGNAEDVARVVSVNYSYGAVPELDRAVPAGLALQLCRGDCIVIQESQPLEPGKFERKYYARGLGLFAGVNPNAGTTVQLTNCNFDSRCVGLPQPTN